jgi:hypothetical protein
MGGRCLHCPDDRRWPLPARSTHPDSEPVNNSRRGLAGSPIGSPAALTASSMMSNGCGSGTGAAFRGTGRANSPAPEGTSGRGSVPRGRRGRSSVAGWTDALPAAGPSARLTGEFRHAAAVLLRVGLRYLPASAGAAGRLRSQAARARKASRQRCGLCLSGVESGPLAAPRHPAPADPPGGGRESRRAGSARSAARRSRDGWLAHGVKQRHSV